MNNEERQLKKSLISRAVIIGVISTVLVLLAISSFAWFAQGGNVGANGMLVAVATRDYEVYVKKTSTYNYTPIGEDEDVYGGIENAMYSAFASDGYDTNYETDSASYGAATGGPISFELMNEHVFEQKRYLMPGSYGTVTFYVKPTVEDGDITVDLTLELGAYKKVYYSEDDRYYLNKVVSAAAGDVPERVLNLLNGHILFFTGRTGTGDSSSNSYKYTGLIDDGHFTFSSAGKTKTDGYYVITLYWEWPEYYDEITSDNCGANANDTSKKYPYELNAFIEDNLGYFFEGLAEANVSDQSKRIDAYNNGDQLIGDGADCLVLYLKAN